MSNYMTAMIPDQTFSIQVVREYTLGIGNLRGVSTETDQIKAHNVFFLAHADDSSFYRCSQLSSGNRQDPYQMPRYFSSLACNQAQPIPFQPGR